MTADPTEESHRRFHDARAHAPRAPLPSAGAEDGAVPEGDLGPGIEDTGSWVVVVARNPAERARIARRLGALVPLVMVRSADEAHTVLRALAGRPDEAPVAAVPDDLTSIDSRDDDADQALDDSLVARTALHVTGLFIDTDRHVARSPSGEVRLTPLEHAFMLCLLRRPGRVWTFAELTRAVWGTDHLGSASGSVHAVVKRLRHKLERISTPASIEAIRGIGFRLSLPDPAPERA